MPFTKSDLMAVLNREESFSNKIKIADNVFKSSELLLPHKEVVLLEWVIKNSHHDYKKAWKAFNNWTGFDQFKELSRNDISYEEIRDIVELLKGELMMEKVDKETLNILFNSLSLLMENSVFQHYFKYDIEGYCTFVSCILDKIYCLDHLEEFLEKGVFLKTITTEKKFQKYFLDSILPALAQSLLTFDTNGRAFEKASKVIQKCIFYNNHRNFKMFINQFFEDGEIEKQVVPKTLFKNILNFYSGETNKVKLEYKLVFHAFSCAYNSDFELLYKFFVLLLHMIGFDLKEKLILFKTSKLEINQSELSQNKSQEILFELLNVLSEIKSNLNYGIECKTCRIKETTFSDFVRNILKQLLYFNVPSGICYKIFIKTITIDPTVIEPIIEDIIIYAMMTDNHNQQEEYESLIISVFEVYSKLRQIERLVGKTVRALHDAFLDVPKVLQEVYKFSGIRDVNILVIEAQNFKVDVIFTENILRYLSTSICSLASWQVISVFKTLLYFIRSTLSYISEVLDEDPKHFIYMEILSVLICTLLSSIRVAEHTVANNVVKKSIKELKELRSVLENLGKILLNREHNHILMRSFLNIAYHWGEMHLILAYYSASNDVQLEKTLDNDFTPCNITYLHSYLNVKQWCLISERITNFGEVPCKQLLNKMYIQKLRAMLLFEKSVSDDILTNVVRSIATDLKNNWKDILCDKYIVDDLLPKIDSSSIIFLAESLINDTDQFKNLHKQPHILNSSLLLTAVNYVTIIKINKLLSKRKRKLGDDTFTTAISTKICSLFTENVFLSKEDHEETIKKAKQMYHSGGNYEKDTEWRINEDKIIHLFEILQKFPVIYSSEIAQKMYLLYFSSVHKDLSVEFGRGNCGRLQTNCEKIIIGVLQYNKFKLLDLFKIELFCKEVVKSYKEWELIFSLITENVLRCEHIIKEYESVVTYFTKKLPAPVYLHSCIIIINAVNKLKKTKVPKDVKIIAEKYKSMVCDKILELVTQSEPEAGLVNGYSHALRTFLSYNDDEKLEKLLNYLNSYVDFALKDTENSEKYLILFITLLQNRSKIPLIDDQFAYKVWNAYKENERINSTLEEYSQLAVLIFGLVPVEMFTTVTTDLLYITDKLINIKDFALLGRYLKTWESILSCNLNPIKTKILLSALEKLLQKLIFLIQGPMHNEDLYENILKFEKAIIQTTHLILAPPVIDILILSVTLLMTKEDADCQIIFNLSISILENLLRYRKPLIMDRLPPYLHQYRIILRSLCKRSNSDLNLEDTVIRQISDCAHQLEKLTKNLVACQKDMGRIAVYLIADILEQYEQVTLYAAVKIHLNNCIYSLMSICDQHAVTYLMRVLSSSSTEIFKMLYENYKKYYRFTGKV